MTDGTERCCKFRDLAGKERRRNKVKKKNSKAPGEKVGKS